MSDLAAFLTVGSIGGLIIIGWIYALRPRPEPPIEEHPEKRRASEALVTKERLDFDMRLGMRPEERSARRAIDGALEKYRKPKEDDETMWSGPAA